jgi:diguanylate cyclase (GGDEF)-like protein
VIGITGYTRDITDRKLAEKALEMSQQEYSEMSIRDPISGLYNLRYFYESLKTEVERVNRYQYPLSILMLDIDNFKSINNRYGHQEGDRVIMRMGEIIRRYIRQVDSAYRFGGEEFSIILPETEDEEAIQVADRIRLGFKKENFSPKIDEKFHLTVSIGVARYFPKEEVIAFLKRVDDNLYTAKSQGKDRVYYQEKGGGSSFLM